VAVLREEGSNGDREMTAAFYLAGFDVRDVTMSDLVSKRTSLSEFRGLAFVGGFSFADVLGSAKGWGAQLKYSNALDELKAFFAREDTFSIGICNGCQLMALLGLTPFADMDDTKKPRFLHNESGRFESRFTTLRVEKGNPSIFFKEMEGSVLGCWSSHGEGRAYFPDDSVLQEILDKNLAPIRYVNDQGEPTQDYPFNPNGSTNAIAGLCSVDGRHTAIMPHPERTCFPWSWPHTPSHLQKEFAAQEPWMKMFHNARIWCDNL
jgi:phosphoribosylformylglycinamidine synthase